MRTTLDIDDDLLNALRPVAVAQGRSLGRLISDLARSAMEPRHSAATRSGFPVFDVPPGTTLFGADDVAKALDE